MPTTTIMSRNVCVIFQNVLEIVGLGFLRVRIAKVRIRAMGCAMIKRIRAKIHPAQSAARCKKCSRPFVIKAGPQQSAQFPR